jgi:hypothetical protein
LLIEKCVIGLYLLYTSQNLLGTIFRVTFAVLYRRIWSIVGNYSILATIATLSQISAACCQCCVLAAFATISSTPFFPSFTVVAKNGKSVTSDCT